MNHLKTFETFFSFSMRDKISEEDLFTLISVNREMIQDLLVEFEDKLPDVHISINFDNIYNNRSRIISGFRRSEGKLFVKDGDDPIEELRMIISFYPNKYLLDKIEGRIKSIPKEKLTETSWYDLVLDGIDLQDEIESFQNRLERMGFFEFNILPRKELKIEKNPLVYLQTNNHPNLPESEYGLSFLTIFARKKVNENI
jgi:hypothetical protein